MSRPKILGGWTAAAFAALYGGCAAHHAHLRPTPPVMVPKGCEGSLAGQYQWQANPSFRYLGQDDGGTLTLFLRREQLDGGTGEVTDPGNTRLELTRTPNGFTGRVLSTQLNALKAPCPVAIPAALTTCNPTGLTVRTMDRTALDEQCHTPANGSAADG